MPKNPNKPSQSTREECLQRNPTKAYIVTAKKISLNHNIQNEEDDSCKVEVWSESDCYEWPCLMSPVSRAVSCAKHGTCLVDLQNMRLVWQIRRQV